MFLNLSHNIGKKKPNGTNKSIFKQALMKSETISKNGIMFTAKSIFRDAILGKPTSAKTAVKYSLQGTTQGRYLTGGVPPVRFSM